MRQTLMEQVAASGLVEGDVLLVAVSGGVDSVVLLHLLHGLQAEHGLQLQVAHLDHQIRAESSSDAVFVQKLCEQLGVPSHVERQDVPRLAKLQTVSMEMAARHARRDFLSRVANEIGARLIALAHHRADQAETVLLRLLRGSGTAGLAGMKSVHEGFWRPLLGCSQEQVLEYAGSHRLQWVEDASNVDSTYLRNRLRHQLLPQLRELNPQLDERLAELCHQLQDESDFWQQQVDQVLPGLIRSEADGLRLDRQGLLALPRALRVRVVREALRRLRGDLQRLESVHLNAIDHLLLAERSQGQLDLPGCWVARRYHELWLRSEAPEVLAAYEVEFSVPGELQLPCGRIIRACLQDEQQGESRTVSEFSVSELGFPLVLRNWRAGDSFEPSGMAGGKRLKRYFADRKVELQERSRVPLLVSAGKILWLAGQRRSRNAIAGQVAGQILRVELV